MEDSTDPSDSPWVSHASPFRVKTEQLASVPQVHAPPPSALAEPLQRTSSSESFQTALTSPLMSSPLFSTEPLSTIPGSTRSPATASSVFGARTESFCTAQEELDEDVCMSMEETVSSGREVGQVDQGVVDEKTAAGNQKGCLPTPPPDDDDDDEEDVPLALLRSAGRPPPLSTTQPSNPSNISPSLPTPKSLVQTDSSSNTSSPQLKKLPRVILKLPSAPDLSSSPTSGLKRPRVMLKVAPDELEEDEDTDSASDDDDEDMLDDMRALGLDWESDVSDLTPLEDNGGGGLDSESESEDEVPVRVYDFFFVPDICPDLIVLLDVYIALCDARL